MQRAARRTRKHHPTDNGDAFWHSRGITVKDSVIEGEHPAWYSTNLTLIGCTIRGTQPFCYCKGLRLVDCVMEKTDLCFERSEVDAAVLSSIDSAKNPHLGHIVAKEIGKIILDDQNSACDIETQSR